MLNRPEWLSQGAEVLLEVLAARAAEAVDYDVVVVGSGYGGAVAASRLARARTAQDTPLSVCVLERGREYVPGAFPTSLAELPGELRFSRYDDPVPKVRREGLFDFRLGADVSVLVANGLGGGSLINASVAEAPHEDVLDDPAWPAALHRDRDALREGYDAARGMLGAAPAQVAGLEKYAALEALARVTGNTARPVHIAVHTEAGVNAQGVQQEACIGCGDCVTGCNFRAKNTLPMNYLADARRAGASLFTGATVCQVARAGEHWRVSFLLTEERHPPLVPRVRSVRARHVILAAGTLGSTEILMRSRAHGLRVSETLGTRFSGNGDMISVLYGQRERVNAAPQETTEFRQRRVGPTITGMIESGGPRAERIVFQELAIPAPLRRLFEEVVTTGALPHRIARIDWSLHGPADTDPAAVDPDAIERSQVLAAFGDDGAGGSLELIDGWQDNQGDGAIRVRWKGAGTLPHFEHQDARLAHAEALGGHYVRSPLWRPAPEQLSAALSGPKPEGKLFTVHPLGGCPMGDDAEHGVVDDLGRVFDPADPAHRSRTHDGLLVLDGSIVPVALGINPLLTITALAERAVQRYAEARGWTIGYGAPARPLPAPPDMAPPRVREPPDTAVRFAEKMSGALALRRGSTAQDAVLSVEFAPIEGLQEFLRRGPHEVRIASATLAIGGAEPVSLRGTVQWMERGRSNPLSRIARGLWTWVNTRGLADWFQRWREDGLHAAVRLFYRGGSILGLASNVGEVRHLRYLLELERDLVLGGNEVLPAGTCIEGLKTFRYCVGGNPWSQLAEMTITLVAPGGQRHEAGMLKLDLEHLLKRFAGQFQIVRQRDQPGAISELAAIAMFMLRVVLKVHFWNFRLPEYEPFDPERARRRMPGELESLRLRRYTVQVRTRGGTEDIALPLTRYWQGPAEPPPAEPVLLIHGFGSSGAQFAHPGQARNLVRHLAESGRDVWVAELRTSIAVPSSLNLWTLDEIAAEDIPAIVAHVLDASGHAQLDVVAHCIGSAMFCTAVLAGRLAGRVRRAVLLQVGPLITLSPGNRFRGYLAAAMRRYMLSDHVDSSVDSRADWLNALIDRLLYTYPYDEVERRHHELLPPWRPHRHLANCNRSAAVFGRLFQHDNVAPEMLGALGDLLGHTNLRTFEQTVQYAFMGRLTDYDAVNSYVTDDAVRAYFDFPVRFLHGECNDVFAPETTERSQRLLKDVFGESHPAERIPLPGYGHLDPLIGRHAERDVFRYVSEFLDPQRATAGDRAVPPRVLYLLRPLIGPLLGWTRRDNGTWVTRLWCRTDDSHAFAVYLIATVLDADGNAIPGHTRMEVLQVRDQDRWGAVDRLGWIDVPLPEGTGDCRIAVVGAYESSEANRAPGGARVPAELAAATLASLKAARQLPPEQQADPYGAAVAQLLPAWHADVSAGSAARFTCDPGYDQQPDSALVTGALRAGLGQDGSRLEFALACCRFNAAGIDRERADASFGRMRDLLERPPSGAAVPSLLLLAGDQIYSDATAGLFDPKNRRGRFYDSYREAWTAPNARAVLRRLPTYMMMDDHEVGNDWHSRDRHDPAMRRWGLEAFRDYQMLHSPRNADALCAAAGVAPPDPAYFYSFAAGGFPFFVCDTRSERQGRDSIIDWAQRAALCQWLRDQEHALGSRPKFVMSPSVVVPYLRATLAHPAYAARSDGWDGFPWSLGDLFSSIARDGVRNVVFLCGDPHLSLASQIVVERPDAPPLQALCIVAAPMYAPYPFVNAQTADFARDNDAAPLRLENGAQMRYRLLGEGIEGDGFSVVSVAAAAAGWSVTIQMRRADGAPDPAPLLRILPSA